MGHTGHVKGGECDDHSDKDNGKSTFAENIETNENLVSLVLDNRDKSSKEHLLDNNFLPFKRNRVYSADKHFVGHLREKQVCINECDDFLRNTKRIKCYASTSFDSKKEKTVSQLGKEVSENSTERILLISEKGEHQTEKINWGTMGGGSIEDSHNRCTASNLCQSSNQNEVVHDESNIPFDATLMPQHTFGGENSQQKQIESIATDVACPDEIQHKISGSKPWSKHETDLQLEDPNGSQQTVASDKAQDDTGNSWVEVTADKIVYQGENINVLMKKYEEQNLGMKCKEVGQLLFSDATPVSLVVPESCVGMATTIMPQHTSGAEPCQNKSMDESNDNAHHVYPIPSNGDNADKIQHMINESQPKQNEPNVVPLNFSQSQKPVASDKTVVATFNGCEAELSSDSDRYHNEKIDLAAKKHEFLSSQCTYVQGFSAMTESTEQNLCMKCNERGQLLVCKTTTCPMMVHKNCLGVSAQLDGKGNFVCPFCVYSDTISEYLEAKEKASLARKELAIFISKGIRNQAVHEFHRQEHSPSRKNSMFIHVNNIGNDELTGCEDNREYHVGGHANEVSNLQFERSQPQAPISCVPSSCREKENVNNGLIEALREEERSEMQNAKSLTGGRVEENQVLTDHVDGCGGDKYSCKKANIVCDSQSNGGEEVPQELTKQHNMDGTVEPVCAHDTGKKEISEDGCEKHIISRYSMRFRKHETQYKPQASPLLRRKKIPWTAEEEELIREGVQKFGSSDQTIPWKKILAFGSHVFEKDDKRRTPVDLKDKWKNMCKAHSKSK
ncbi:uncharacterized protein LOC133302210 isoform X2 [Gastrolobium bilobum]|nr:uncharacterized protein LOC133302210 isoform X2 [Gastrolobium bilobum]